MLYADGKQVGVRMETIAKQARETSVAGGIAGAVLGGLVGCIPWILIGLMGYVASIGGVLISLAAYYGYKLFGGKLGTRTVYVVNILTVAAMTFIATILAECAIFYMDAVKEGYEVNIPALLELGFSLPFDAELAGETGIWGSLAMSYLYAALGTWFSLSSIAKKRKHAPEKGFPAFSQLDEDAAAQPQERT